MKEDPKHENRAEVHELGMLGSLKLMIIIVVIIINGSIVRLLQLNHRCVTTVKRTRANNSQQILKATLE